MVFFFWCGCFPARVGPARFGESFGVGVLVLVMFWYLMATSNVTQQNKEASLIYLYAYNLISTCPDTGITHRSTKYGALLIFIQYKHDISPHKRKFWWPTMALVVPVTKRLFLCARCGAKPRVIYAARAPQHNGIFAYESYQREKELVVDAFSSSFFPERLGEGCFF